MSADGARPSFALHAALGAAVHSGDRAALREAANGWQRAGGSPTALLGLLRYLHLFLGFPRVVRALDALEPYLPSADAATPDPPDDADWLQAGTARFREVYGEDADRVLARLAQLDAGFRDWVLEHAYGRTGAAHGMELALAERLAVLALAATGCWDQCRSHLRAALRHGVPAARLLGDVEAGGWLTDAARGELVRRIEAE